MKVGLVTMHNVCNMGAVLQSYALSQKIESLGFECEIIDYVPEVRKTINIFFPYEKSNSLSRNVLSWIKWFPARLRWQKQYRNFRENFLNISKGRYVGDNSLNNVEEKYDIFVTGSDQVWNAKCTGGINKEYFLGFVKDKLKLSYAASVCYVEEQDESLVRKYLCNYKAISVREDSIINRLEDITGKNNIVQVLDPIFLIDNEKWMELQSHSSIEVPKCEYLLIFELGTDKELLIYAKKIAKKLGLKIVHFGWRFFKTKDIDYGYYFKKPQDFIKLFMNASYIVTNSFHGTAFSIKFQKDFIVKSSTYKNPRFISILKLFKIEDRLVDEGFSDVAYKKINYDEVNVIIEREQIFSCKFLEEALEKGR